MKRVRVLGPWVGAVLVLGCELVPRETSEGAAPSATASAPPSAAVAAAPVPAPPVPAPSISAAASASAPVPPEPDRAVRLPKLLLSPGAEASRLALNQLRMVPADGWVKAKALHEVTVYVVFREPFSRRLELRAEGADGAELGRSEREAPLAQPGDSARYLSFRFDARMPLDKVAAFVAHVDPLPELAPPLPKNFASMKPSPKPQPEPQFIRPPGPDLVPKNP